MTTTHCWAMTPAQGLTQVTAVTFGPQPQALFAPPAPEDIWRQGTGRAVDNRRRGGGALPSGAIDVNARGSAR
jgi:hypothetical protein